MPVLRYSLLRLAALLASFGLFYLIGMRGWPWLIVSVLVAGAVSYLTLRGQRDAAVGSLAARAAAVDDPVRGQDEDAEDAALDALDAAEQRPVTQQVPPTPTTPPPGPGDTQEPRV
ncbi:DUF4229 domain-containing protein [Litorihabitans aurantiacus]|uniref:DUF4229 domain-containing protein n=1 Tax=Litorihabitans aurantiacus TaxID=1930061 RepID=A0AA37XFP1_9MICO|nr:DUF4229 domain-containing protein [Litorihabitans aurantiacus]GMA32403.1 hypothetical protein GCM10025875_23950 [Litorihabitans aurantiacus]